MLTGTYSNITFLDDIPQWWHDPLVINVKCETVAMCSCSHLDELSRVNSVTFK